MRPRLGVLVMLAASIAITPGLQAQARFPINGSSDVNPDVQLRLR